MISQEINTEVVKDFLRAIYKVKKRETKRKINRGNISSHIQKIKRIKLSKKNDKKKIEQEFERLESYIDEALKREKEILEEQRHGSDAVIQLRNRLDILEMQLKKEKERRESLDQIKLALQRIHGEIRHRKRKRIKIKKRETELEKKIRL